MIEWFLVAIVVLIFIYVYIYNVVNQNENKALFYPSDKRIWKPDTKYKNLYINTNDVYDICSSGKYKKPGQSYIHCWHFNNYKNRKTLCFFHGTTGNITHRKYIIDLCHKFKLNLFLFDYSGYGQSSDFPHKHFLRENGEAVYNYLTKVAKIDNENIIIWTESLGCITGSYICSKYNCGGLIISSGFSSLDDVIVNGLEGYKKYASQILVKLLSCKMDFLPVKDYIYNIKCPIVVIHSDADEIVPYEYALTNYKNIKHKDKLFIKIEGTHSSPKITTKQFRKVFRFFSLPNSEINSNSICNMLKDIETFAERHNNFMD